MPIKSSVDHLTAAVNTGGHGGAEATEKSMSEEHSVVSVPPCPPCHFQRRLKKPGPRILSNDWVYSRT